MSHRRVWIEHEDNVSHPGDCRRRETWCDVCGCCEHCFHDCQCAVCGCGASYTVEPVLHVIEDGTP